MIFFKLLLIGYIIYEIALSILSEIALGVDEVNMTCNGEEFVLGSTIKDTFVSVLAKAVIIVVLIFKWEV